MYSIMCICMCFIIYFSVIKTVYFQLFWILNVCFSAQFIKKCLKKTV